MNVPDDLNLTWLKAHAQQKLVGEDNKWSITAWNNIVYIRINNEWTPEEAGEYIDHISGIPGILGERWGKVYLVFDISNMEFRMEDAPLYLRSNWLEVLDQDVLSVCIVEEKKMRRVLWQSLYAMAGRADKVKIFPHADRALAWLKTELVEAQNEGSRHERENR